MFSAARNGAARRSWLASLKHQPWPPSSAITPRLDPRQPAEEEKTPYWDPSSFYPVCVGQVLNGRYQIATKLGYGSSSTVWLARDLDQWRWSKERYVALKVNAASRDDTLENELAILKRVSTTSPQHPGWTFVRQLEDSVALQGTTPGKQHVCMVHEALREPLWLYRKRFIGGVIPPHILKVLLQMVLQGLDFLHTECQIIHTDIKPDNIMVKLEDASILERDALDEHQNPSPQKVLEDGRAIHLSRNDYGRLTAPTGMIRITDLGLAVSSKGALHYGCIQAEPYRAPEVVLDAGYSYSADIWSFGVMLWDLLEGRRLFDTVCTSEGHEHDDQTHLAQITALLGQQPPATLLANGRRTSLFYQPEGSLKDPTLIPADFSFDNSVTVINGKEKAMFIRFIDKMIRWDPKERSTANELLQEPWLHEDFPEDTT